MASTSKYVGTCSLGFLLVGWSLPLTAALLFYSGKVRQDVFRTKNIISTLQDSQSCFHTVSYLSGDKAGIHQCCEHYPPNLNTVLELQTAEERPYRCIRKYFPPKPSAERGKEQRF